MPPRWQKCCLLELMIQTADKLLDYGDLAAHFLDMAKSQL